MRKRIQPFDPRQIMHSQTFEIFHYQDPRPDDVDLHHHDFYEVFFFLGDSVEYRVEGCTYHLKPGDLLLISPMELHQPVLEPAGTVYERIVLWINKAYLEQFSRGEVSLTHCFDSALSAHSNLLRPTSAQRADLVMRLEELARESYENEYASELCATGLFLQFMVELNRVALRNAAVKEEQGERSRLVSQVLHYISEHYHEDLSLEGLAQQFYVSKYHLSHEFGRVVGVGVYHYITLKRLMIARQMLSSGVLPGVVYSNCGFGDYTNFYRAFKTRYGVSPRECMGSRDAEA